MKRAFDGFKELEKWVNLCRSGNKIPDGYYVTFWRVLFQYPEVLAWETMWNDSVHETYETIYKLVKGIKPNAGVGWHVWHAHSFSPFFRAQTDLKKISKYSDFLKMTVYNNLGGWRMENYITSAHRTMYGDMPIEEALEFEYRIMGYRGRSYEELPYVGLDSSYVLTRPNVASRVWKARRQRSGPASMSISPTCLMSTATLFHRVSRHAPRRVLKAEGRGL